ncbi:MULTISPECIES: tail fiber assembly protein [Providencia]|uniref:tail fiber assembly protein n=1 Tax=Providencia TaxID=586 RepID=UPI001B3883C5|nr:MULTISPECIES: tail fiber assembly protein [Providencia]MBQ0313833.1 tail fiber assembly protein [Providencia rettgeri]MBQ0322537.1 tail fiber assembly protein [Providencia rettgeri]MBQ0348915.1 tail fiber assembly protein [Providencia rettgeri]MBQ0405339.1 tail fiber assembly protein [Providencia rettgeri]MCJ2228275.1 tail fiber assembly protein [Providencia rettgeri]
MKYYININNVVFAYASDGSQDELISSDLVKITEMEALAIAQPMQSVEETELQKQLFLVEANNVIAPLQDAVDFAIATEHETKLLRMWKEYRIDLYRVDTSKAPNIDWPVKP